MTTLAACPFCDARDWREVFRYDEPPAGEVRFEFCGSGSYSRSVRSCLRCGHYLSAHDMDMRSLYGAEYVDSTYGEDGLRRAYERILALPPEKSDNAGRVERVLAFAAGHLAQSDRPPRALDVGSGLCVFLRRMADAGWEGTALDLDRRQVAHARDVVGVGAAHGTIGEVEGIGRFDLVSFNKVLEHVEDPVVPLAAAADHLLPDGFVYVELPDGEMAEADGPDREEFFIDHHHVFSLASTALLARQAGFVPVSVERLREPSTKYTLRAFLRPGPHRCTGSSRVRVPGPSGV